METIDVRAGSAFAHVTEMNVSAVAVATDPVCVGAPAQWRTVHSVARTGPGGRG